MNILYSRPKFQVIQKAKLLQEAAPAASSMNILYSRPKFQVIQKAKLLQEAAPTAFSPR
jgi:hypothetical protein